MIQVKEGLFVVKERMPCSPQDIKIWPYVLLSTLNRPECEEAVARILSFSQELGQWVGVSLAELGRMIEKDYQALRRVEEACRHNFEEVQCIERAWRRRRLFSVLTLGFYALLVSRPTTEMCEIQDENVPLTGIFLFGPYPVISGIQTLTQMGMLKHVREGEGDNVLDVFFPTPALITRIMKEQGVTSATTVH